MSSENCRMGPRATHESRHAPHNNDTFKLNCLDLLDIAQDYRLHFLQRACIEKAKGLSLNRLRELKTHWKIPFDTRAAILEGRIEMLRREQQNVACVTNTHSLTYNEDIE